MPTMKAGELAPHSRVYRCMTCGHRSAMLHGEKAPNCPECGEKTKGWEQTKHRILLTTKSVKDEFEKKSTISDKISDKITSFCGSMTFVYIHAIWFGAWIWYNLAAQSPFDPYPFGFLVLVVSLEAIILATFILVSQNRENVINSVRSELDYQIDLRSAKMLAEIRSMLSEHVVSTKVKTKQRKTRNKSVRKTKRKKTKRRR